MYLVISHIELKANPIFLFISAKVISILGRLLMIFFLIYLPATFMLLLFVM